MGDAIRSVVADSPARAACFGRLMPPETNPLGRERAVGRSARPPPGRGDTGGCPLAVPLDRGGKEFRTYDSRAGAGAHPAHVDQRVSIDEYESYESHPVPPI